MKKKFLKIAGVIVILLAGVSFLGYNKYFKPDLQIQQELTNQFGSEFFTSFDDKKVENNSGGAVDNLDSTNEAKSGDDSNEMVDTPNKEQEKSEPGKISTPVNDNINSKVITQDEINNKYRPQFSYLQSVALSRLDTLYSAAIQEYAQRKKDGTMNRSELAQKYIQAGTMLEANVDRQFNSTLNAMQAELIANNLSTDIVGVIESEYENAKSNKRSQLLAKVRS